MHPSINQRCILCMQSARIPDKDGPVYASVDLSSCAGVCVYRVLVIWKDGDTRPSCNSIPLLLNYR